MRFAALAFAVLGTAGIVVADAPLGKKPAYTDRELSPFPNAQAITKRIWVPGLDDGYVPQGVTFQAGVLFISSYRSTDPKQDRGPCRVFAVDPETGIVLSQIDLPSQCGHAMPIGIEDISFEPGGALWSLSEAGSRRWNAWSAFYPLALRIDVSLLR